MANLTAEGECLNDVVGLELSVCQLCCWDMACYTDQRAADIIEESRKSGVRITSLWAGWPGPQVWDFIDGPRTLGLVPREFREERIASQKKAGEWAKKASLPAIVTHLGFIPEDPNATLYAEIVEIVKDIAVFLKKLDLKYWFETGQETPVTMLRLIEDVGTDNLGINMDAANLMLYGKGNPVDALDVFGQHVRGIHAKDGVYPTDGRKLGCEVQIGEGKVNFPVFVNRLKEIGFDGAFIIEREISNMDGQQSKDIAVSVKYLRSLIEA